MRTAFAIALIFAATALLAQEPPASPPANPWTGNLGAGLALTSGNTDTQTWNLSAAAKYEPKTRFLFKGDALYLRGSTNGEKQVDKATAAARGEYTLSERTFAFGEVSYLRDPFKAISYLIAPVAGGGIRLIRTDTRSLTVDAAVGAQIESNTFVGRTSSGAVKAGENFEWTLSPASKVTQKLTGLWKTNDFADALYHFDVGVAATIATRAELKLAYTYDYKARPVPSTLEKGDSALFAALLFKF
jgi:putative salt-induced outer membrane protein